MVQPLDDARRRRPAGGGSSSRVPPHNLEAEQSLLGAMLLSRDAIVSAVEIQLTPDDFYRPAHGHIYDAITSIYGQGEPADPVTVAEELRRAGLLETIGGPSAIVALQANTPAIGNAGRYAHIVEEHSLLRRLIGVAGDIADMGYSVPDDVTAAIDEAESLVFEVAQRRVTDSLAPLRDLLERHLDHIEALYERGQDITGVPTGFIDLDQQLAGLQPSNLVIVGGRPGTGKALSLDTPIATPAGWTAMGDLNVGDAVFDEQGRPCRVTFATPVMHGHPCYEVSLDDGSSLVADADHQWFAHDSRDDTARVVTTQQMADAGEWSIPLAKPLDLPDAGLPIDPYAMGGWLAAGTSTPTPVSSSDTRSSRPAEKHIPTAYLRSSVKQRIALLEGIVDAASCVPERYGTVELSLGDRRLLGEVHELVASLGYKPGPIRTRSVLLPGGRLGRTWWFSWTTMETPCPTRAVTAVRPVASVPVRCITVDSPNHLYLAGRSFVPTHNTSFALGIVAHAAVESRTPVLLFSLEMSHLELTQRMLCAEARVDATRMRNGRLLETDWPKISHAVGRLAEAPVFIDDNPRLTVMEIRAKARRLKSRAGLGLIVIDYLQLMTGRTSAENRQVEVSEISRGLKILARELQVPVVALSQLSRGLETRADKRPVLADLRESGCMPASTRVLRADTGEEVSLGELVLTQEQPLLWSLDNRWRLVPARVTKVFPSGIRPVFRLRLASGRSVEATGNHPFLTIDGWSRLDALTVGAFVAVPRRLPAPLRERQDWADDDLMLLAHLIGNGTMGPGFTYATGDPANKQLVEDLVSRCFGITSRATRAANTWQLWFPSPYRLGPGVNHPMRNWLEPLGLWRSRAHARYVPPSVLGCDDRQVALFLHHLWATDGSITIGRNRRGRFVSTYYATTSKRLALDVQTLLLRFGIRTTIGKAKKLRRGAPKEGEELYQAEYSVRIQGAANQAHFLRVIACHGERGECIPAALAILDGIGENPDLDLVPAPVRERITEAASASGVSHREIATGLGERYCGSYLLGSEARPRRFSRDRLERIANIVGSSDLRDLATSDVYWDEVLEVVATGEQPTFDATIEGTHNFIADGIIAHNSLEQDADVVIFLYRDEVYNRDSPDRGTAEVIVAKHRNGPTGMTQLAFLDHYTRFANMARGV